MAQTLRGIGYTAETVRAIPERHAGLRDDPLALAVRLFRDHGAITKTEAVQLALPPWLLAEMEGGWKSQFRLDPIHSLFLLSDWPGEALDEVLPPGETTAILARVISGGHRYESVLDLGCGSGTLGLLLADRAAKVTLTDLNARAILLSARNAELNSIAHVIFRQGSLFEPVQTATFDLIVSQPPFIPRLSGAATHLFLHGGARGDELARELINGVADHLRPAGHALVFCDWPLKSDESVFDRIAGSGLPVDAYLAPRISLASYAQAYGAELEAHLRALGVTGVQQSLLHLTHGIGQRSIEVLPHEWRTLSVPLS